MTSLNSPEAGRLNEAYLQKEMQGLDQFADQLLKEAPGDPRLPTCMALKDAALGGLKQAILSLNLPGGANMASTAMDGALEKYNKAVTIRAEIIRDKLLTMNAGLVRELQAQIPKDAEANDPRVRPLQELIKIAEALTTTESNPYFQQLISKDGKKSIAVAMNTVDAHRKTVAEIKQTGSLLGLNIGTSIERMERSLDFVASTDPIRNGYSNLQKTISTMSGSFDSRPVRILAVIGGGIITALGGGMMIRDRITKGEWSSATWPMYLWAGITAIALKPSLISSGLMQNITQLKDVNAMGKEGLLSITAFKGEEGAKAIEEVVELQKHGELKPLLSQKTLSTALVGTVANGKSALMKVFGSMKTDTERARTLNEIAKQSSHGNGELLTELVRTRDKIDFT